MKPETRIYALLDEAIEVALIEIERRARKIMKDHPGVTFCMGMGTASFYNKNGPMWDDIKYLDSFYRWLNKFDHFLKLTGCPMKIESHDGPLLKDW